MTSLALAVAVALFTPAPTPAPAVIPSPAVAPSPPTSAPAPASAPAGPTFTALAPRPCPVVEGKAEAQAADWRDALAALRATQADTVGLPSERAVLRPLFVALAVAQDHACAATAPTEAELAQAREVLAGEGSPALKDTLRGLLALSLEQAGRPAEAAPLWVELRAAERPSEWLVRAWLASGDARSGGDLAFSATQLYQRALEFGGGPARCYAAWRLAEGALATPAPPADCAAAVVRAREAAAAGRDDVCAWVRAEMDRTLPAEYRAR